MVFLNPLFLWALLGLSAPIAIHFWSKKKVKTIKIGSTRFLSEMNPKQTSNVRLNEWVLLLLRTLIIALIALILAAPRMEIFNNERSITYLVETSLLGSEKVNKILDTISDSEVRLLEPGLPLLTDIGLLRSEQSVPNYWQLAQQMENLETDSIVVLTKGLQSGFKGMRPELSVPIHWLLIDTVQSTSSVVEAVKSTDQVVLTAINSNHRFLDYDRETFALNNSMFTVDLNQDSILIKSNNEAIKLPLLKEKVTKVLIAADVSFSAETIYLSSAFEALSKYLKQDIQITSVKELQGIDLVSFDVLVWLKQDSLLTFLGKKLLWKPDELAQSLIEPGVSNDVYLLRRHLDAENSIDLYLPEQLIGLLGLHTQLPDHMQILDMRAMDMQEIQVYKDLDGFLGRPQKLKDISSWLWFLLLLLLPAERILSKFRKQ
jgi:hypothetical protein